MTRIGRRLIEDFLLPALNNEDYGDLLKWVDKEKGIFSIRWSHKNAAKWTLDDTAVFQDWDKLKGRYRPEQKGYFMQAKQRFRAALYKLSSVEKLSSQDKHIKYYRLRLDADKKHEVMSKKMQKMAKKEENQKSIPTPVICRNTYGKGTELVGKDYCEESSRSSSSSVSPYSIKSEDCDQVQEKVEFSAADYQEYQHALKRQRKQSSPNHYPQQTFKTERTTCQTSVLRESPQMNMVCKSYLPTQQMPVYNAASCQALEKSPKQFVEKSPKQFVEKSQNQLAAQNVLKIQAVENSQPRVESPSILLVPTYHYVKGQEDYFPSNEPECPECAVISFLASAKRMHNADGAFLATAELKRNVECKHNAERRLNAERRNNAECRNNAEGVFSANVERRHNAEGVLNLSVRCDTPEVLCR